MSVSDPKMSLVTPQEPDTPEELVKSRQRIEDHGEVFTPSWMVEDMLNLVKTESERIDSRFLEPACGSGNFLKSVLSRKLATVEARYGKNHFEKRHFALFSVMCVYGIELLEDNLQECRENLLQIYCNFLDIKRNDVWALAASNVLAFNILQGDALRMTTVNGEHIQLPEWAYLGAGKFQRRDFRYDSLTQRSSIAGTLFEDSEESQIFIPTKTFPPMTVEVIAK
jgi:hypothetical protein